MGRSHSDKIKAGPTRLHKVDRICLLHMKEISGKITKQL